jgi:hypothetical protein
MMFRWALLAFIISSVTTWAFGVYKTPLNLRWFDPIAAALITAWIVREMGYAAKVWWSRRLGNRSLLGRLIPNLCQTNKTVLSLTNNILWIAVVIIAVWKGCWIGLAALALGSLSLFLMFNLPMYKKLFRWGVNFLKGH